MSLNVWVKAKTESTIRQPDMYSMVLKDLKRPLNEESNDLCFNV